MYKRQVYTLMGVVVALAAVTQVSRTRGVDVASAGLGYELAVSYTHLDVYKRQLDTLSRVGAAAKQARQPLFKTSRG